MIKAVLSDFDGTLVSNDMLDVVCEITGKERESWKLNKDFINGKLTGFESIIARINLIEGVTLSQIREKLKENTFLIKGAEEWVKFLKDNHIILILYSGNITPILEYYQKLLDIPYIVGRETKINNGTIMRVGIDDFPVIKYKLNGIKRILDSLSINPQETLAIGDSRADIPIFKFAGKSIAINPKGEEIKKIATYIIDEDLTKAIEIIKAEMR
jgi:phosphoserine phosphatase